ncbi:Oxysterol binding protein, partial [Caligus rogercresseyi]
AQENPKAEEDSEEEVHGHHHHSHHHHPHHTQDEEEEEIEDDMEKRELLTTIKALATKLETCHNLILKNYSPLQTALDEASGLSSEKSSDLLKEVIKTIKERSSLFKLASDMLLEASSDFLDVCLSQEGRWQKVLASERIRDSSWRIWWNIWRSSRK